jgi:hypothetical protein
MRGYAFVGAGAALLAGCSLLHGYSDLVGPDGSDAGLDAGASDAALSFDGTDAPGGDVVDAGADGSPPTGIALIQSAKGKSRDGGSAMEVAFPTPVTAHDAIVVCVHLEWQVGAQQISAITDSLGNTYTLVVGPVDGVYVPSLYVAMALDVRGGSDSVTVRCALPVTQELDVYVHEFSGIALAGAFDVRASASGATPAMSSGPATTTADNELVIGFGETNRHGTVASGTGFTNLSINDQSVNGDILDEYLVAPHAGEQQATATTASGANWAMVMATFKAR